MLAYELYTFNNKKGYELIGVLPEKRKNPARITMNAVVNWVSSLSCDNVDSKNIFFKPLRLDANDHYIKR
jgi:hypothetical protein